MLMTDLNMRPTAILFCAGCSNRQDAEGRRASSIAQCNLFPFIVENFPLLNMSIR